MFVSLWRKYIRHIISRMYFSRVLIRRYLVLSLYLKIFSHSFSPFVWTVSDAGIQVTVIRSLSLG